MIVDHHTAVQKLSLKIREMIPTLPKPTDWALLEADDEAKQLFLLSFRDANDQLRLVMHTMSLSGTMLLSELMNTRGSSILGPTKT